MRAEGASSTCFMRVQAMRTPGRRVVALSLSPSFCARALKASEVTVLFAHFGRQEAFATMCAQCSERKGVLARFGATFAVQDALRTSGLAPSSSSQTLWPAQVGAEVDRLDLRMKRREMM